MSSDSSQEFGSLDALPDTRTWIESRPTSLALHAGAKPLSEYQLVRLLGEGGFGQVWLARGPGGFEVALKFIKLGGAAGATEMQALEMMKGIRHPHLLAVFGVWVKEEWLIVAMELADKSLLDRLREATAAGQSGIPRGELLEYMREAAKGLDHLSSLNIIHRDVKPHNLFLAGGGVKVADYGLARMLERTMATVSTKMTPAYAAPEIMDGKATPWSDQYSLAVTYCHLRGDRLPFPGSMLEMMAGHANKPPDLSMIPPEERHVLERALAKEPQKRWSSCKEFVEALAATTESNATQVSVTPPVPVSPAEDSSPTQVMKRRRQGTQGRQPVNLFLVSCLGLALALALTLGYFLFLHPQALPPQEPPDKPSTVDTSLTNSLGMVLVLVPPGEYQRGSPAGEQGHTPSDEQQRLVQIPKAFHIGAHEVTRGQFRRFAQATGYQTELEKKGRPDSWRKHQAFDQDDDHPVLYVSWHDAMAFCRWLSATENRTYRLPTEDEWEYACRSRTTTVFHTGDTLSSQQANMDGTKPYGVADKGPARGKTTPVGSFPPNAWRLHDMHGNVWEWCMDSIQLPVPKPVGLRDEPEVAPPAMVKYHFLRGGSWESPGWACRAAARRKTLPSYGGKDVGFRVVLVAP